MILLLEAGRVSVNVVDENLTRVLTSWNVAFAEGIVGRSQPQNDLNIRFVTDDDSQIRFRIDNNAPESLPSIADIGRAELFDLGPSSREWMGYLRLPLGVLQSLFVTAAIVPLVLLGLLLVVWRRRLRAALFLLIVPAYYVVFQSAL